MMNTLKNITGTVWFRLSLLILLIANLVLLSLVLFPVQAESIDLSLVKEAVNLLDRYGYYPMLENETINYGMIRGMLSEYDDPYTSFYPPPEHEIHMDNLAGKFGGIGVNLYINSEGLYVITPYEDSPALQAGITDGDILISVDGKPASEFSSVNNILSYFHAEEGTIVELEVLRQENSEITIYALTRAQISRPSVHSFVVHQDPDIAVLNINIIGSETPEEISMILDAYLEQGVEYYILDLQNNYGGFLTEAVEISQLFLESSGVILQEIDADQNINDYKVNSVGKYSDLNLVVLINDQTASAAEIIAGALQTYGNVPLIGNHSYKKNTIQLVFELQDTSSMHITNALWRIPDLPYDFEENGLQPDIVVETGEDFFSASLQAAVDHFLNPNP